MNYNIRNLKRDGGNYPFYIFDTSIWLKILRTRIGATSGNDQGYLDFFERFKSRSDKPKVVLTTLIISEIVNRWVRDYGFSEYLQENNDKYQEYIKLPPDKKRKYYKDHYRPTNHYKKVYKEICDDILNYEPFCVCQADEFGSDINLKETVSATNFKLDFNDNYLVLLAQKKKYPIVTDDIDFFVPDITVLTNNYTLINKAKSSIPISSTVTTLGDILKAAQEKKNRL